MNAPMDMQAMRLPPHSIEAEQAVIGGLLIDPQAWDRVGDVLSEDDFYQDGHRRIFRHISLLFERGAPIDALTVSESIKSSNEVDQTGGLAYLGELANEVSSAANIRRYAQTIAEKALSRKLLSASSEIGELAYRSNPRVAVDEAQGLLIALGDTGHSRSDPKTIREILAQVIDETQAASEGIKKVGVETGFADLDARLGPLCAGDYVVIAGRPSMGKTTLAMNIAENAAMAGTTAMVFSLEMGDTQLGMRSLSRFSGIDFEAIRRGRLEEEDWDKMAAGLGRLHDKNLIVDESPALTVAQMLARARRQARKTGVGLVVIDYIGLIQGSPSRTANSKNDVVTEVSAALKAMAKHLGCPVIALSQLNRNVESRNDKRPVMSDLRESGSIEQDADIIVMMYRDEYYNPESPWKGMAEAIVAKHRNGIPGTVNLVSDLGHCQFKDASQEAIAEAMRRTHEQRPVKGRSRRLGADD